MWLYLVHRAVAQGQEGTFLGPVGCGCPGCSEQVAGVVVWRFEGFAFTVAVAASRPPLQATLTVFAGKCGPSLFSIPS